MPATWHHSAFFLQITRKTEPTSGLEPLTCSLQVISQVLQGFAQACKYRIPKLISFLCLALCCTVLRSRWYQSGINRGIAPSQSCSLAHPPEVHPAPHRGASVQLTLDRYWHWIAWGGHHTADGMDEALGQQHCVAVSANLRRKRAW